MADTATLDSVTGDIGKQIAAMQQEADKQTASSQLASAMAAAAKKAMAQTTALQAKTQAASKTAGIKDTQIQAADDAWSKAVGSAPKLDPEGLKATLARALGLADAGDLDTKAAAVVKKVKGDADGVGQKESDALTKAQDDSTKAATTLNEAAKALDDAITALTVVTATLVQQQKAASDAQASAQKLAQAGDRASLIDGVLSYLDLVQATAAIEKAKADHLARKSDVDKAKTDWNAAAITAAQAEATLIKAQLDYDDAVATKPSPQVTLQAIHDGVDSALTPPKAASKTQ